MISTTEKLTPKIGNHKVLSCIFQHFKISGFRDTLGHDNTIL